MRKRRKVIRIKGSLDEEPMLKPRISKAPLSARQEKSLEEVKAAERTRRLLRGTEQGPSTAEPRNG